MCQTCNWKAVSISISIPVSRVQLLAVHCQGMILGKLFTHTFVTKQYRHNSEFSSTSTIFNLSRLKHNLKTFYLLNILINLLSYPTLTYSNCTASDSRYHYLYIICACNSKANTDVYLLLTFRLAIRLRILFLYLVSVLLNSLKTASSKAAAMSSTSAVAFIIAAVKKQ